MNTEQLDIWTSRFGADYTDEEMTASFPLAAARGKQCSRAS